MTRAGLLFLLIITVSASFAQVCDSPEEHPQPDSAFDYVRAEIKGLRWIRRGLELSKSIPPPAAPDHPQRSKQAEVRTVMVRTLNNYYGCAAQVVTPYKDSKIAPVRDSVESILNGIDSSQEINLQVLEALALIDKAPSASDVDPTAAGRLDKLSASAENARNTIMLGVKISIFSLVRTKDDKPGGEPVAFTITAKQRSILAAEVGQLAKERTHEFSFVDQCANMLTSLLAKNIPVRK